MGEDRWKAPMPLTDIDGSPSGEKLAWVAFRAGGSLFRLSLEESRMPSNDEYSFADMRLNVDGTEVLGMSVIQNFTAEYYDWRFATVDTLKVGPWMAEFVEFYSRLRLIEESKMTEYRHSFEKERASRMDLGDAHAN
jgi:hypothetical protein